MYSIKDLERFYFQYQSEALPHGEYLQSFVSRIKSLITFSKNGLRIIILQREPLEN